MAEPTADVDLDPGPMRGITPEGHAGRELYFLLNSLVVPRPIAWVSTRAADGTANLAPHSYFTVVSDDPPMVAFVSIGDKDTVRNAREGGDFVVHVVDQRLVTHMNDSSASAPPDVSEFELAGLEQVESLHVRSPRVAAAPVAIECSVEQVVETGRGRIVIGRCLHFHVAERLFDDRGRVDPGRLDAVARMGGSTYATTRDRFDLVRPAYEDLAAGR